MSVHGEYLFSFQCVMYHSLLIDLLILISIIGYLLLLPTVLH